MKGFNIEGEKWGGYENMTTEKSIIPVERIENSIILIRGEKIMLDADLAILLCFN